MKLPFLPHHEESSFFDFVSKHHPGLALGSHSATSSGLPTVEPARSSGALTVPQATTVLAIKYQ